jgi:hypothetical protein
MLTPPVHRRIDGGERVSSEPGSSVEATPSPANTAWLNTPAGSATIAGSAIGLISTIILIYIVFKYLWPQYRWRRAWKAGAKRRKEDPQFLRQYAQAKRNGNGTEKAEGKVEDKGAHVQPKANAGVDLEKGVGADLPSPIVRDRMSRLGLPNPLRAHPPDLATGKTKMPPLPVPAEAFNAPEVKDTMHRPRMFSEFEPMAKEPQARLSSNTSNPQADFEAEINSSFAIGEESDDE